MAETLRIEIPIETVDNTEPELSNLIKKIGKLGTESEEMGKKAKKSQEYVSGFDRSAEKTQKSLSKWANEKYEVLLEAKERISPVLQTLGSNLRGFAGKSWSVTMKAVDLVTAPVRGIMNLLKNPVVQAGAVLGISVGLADTVNTFKDFEAAMSQVQAVSGATGSELGRLTDKAKEMGSTTKFTATESAEAFNYMAMAGWKTEDMLDGIEGILSLAAASGEALGTTSDIVTDALTAFGLSAGDSGHFADVLAQASSNANTNVSMLGESFKYVAPVAGAMKYSVEDVSLALGLMANASVKGSMSGTALKTSLANLAAPTDKMAEAMDRYGISLTDSQGNMKTLKGVMDNLRSSMGGLSEAEQTAAASTIFGKEAMSGMLAIVNASEADYNKLTEAVNNADGAAKNMAETMQDNLSGSITRMQSALDGVKICFGERLAPYVGSAADWLTDSMPAIEEALDHMMDFVDRKVDKAKRKLKEITSTDEWMDAGLLGKAGILWDKFIYEPLSEWWDTKGHAKFVTMAGNIGKTIGSGLKYGVMALLGIDISETVDEGVSIGASFAKGFSEGFDFDMIGEKLWEGLKDMLSNASKLLPGGEEADLSSLMSAAMLVKVAKPFFSLGSGAFKLGKALFGGTGSGGLGLGGGLKNIIGSFSVADEVAGTGMASGSGLLGAFGKFGTFLGSGATSSAGLVATGAGAAIGGAVGGATLISGGMDLYRAFTSDDSDEADAYAKSGAYKISGVGVGAGIGAAVGSVIPIPVISTAAGALIGAGIGGLVGWIAGDNEIEEYEERMKAIEEEQARADKVFKATGRSVEGVITSSKTLRDAMDDTSVSAEEFAVMYQEAVKEVSKSKWGDITLSLKEVKELADKITFDGQKESIEKFAETVQKTSASLESFRSQIKTLDKLNWEVNLGMKLDEEDKAEYMAAAEKLVADAEDYLKNEHYEMSLAVDLLLGDDSASIKTGIDSTYAIVQSQLDNLNAELTSSIQTALADGFILPDEAQVIMDLQNQIADIINSLNEVKSEAFYEVLGSKYDGKPTDESMAQLQQEILANTEIVQENNQKAFEATVAGLKWNKEYDSEYSDEQYNADYAIAEKAYKDREQKLYDDNMNFQIGKIVEAYEDNLKYMSLPNIEGTNDEKLRKAMELAVASIPDIDTWNKDNAQIAELFGLKGLDTDIQDSIIGYLQSTALTIPQSKRDELKEKMQESIPTVEDIMEQVDFTQWKAYDFEKWTGLDASFARAYEEMFQSETIADSAKQKVAQYIHDNLFLTSQGEEFKELFNIIGSGVADSNLEEASSILRTSAEESVNGAFNDSFDVTANIRITPVYSFADSINSMGVSSKPSSGRDALMSAVMEVGTKVLEEAKKASNNAAGGYVSGGPVLSWLAEEGYGEFIIPTNPSRRTRALELYEQAGEALGVDNNAAGGFVGNETKPYMGRSKDVLNYPSYGLNNVPMDDNEATGDDYGSVVPVSSDSVQTSSVQVSVSMAPEFRITGSEGQSEEDIVNVVKRHIREMADEIGGEIAIRLEEVFSNMPIKAGQ